MKMKKLVSEPDFIGGQGPLTMEEEAELSAYFAKKKKVSRIVNNKLSQKAA